MTLSPCHYCGAPCDGSVCDTRCADALDDARRHAGPDRLDDNARPCAECGEWFHLTDAGTSDPYCSPACREAAEYRQEPPR